MFYFDALAVHRSRPPFNEMEIVAIKTSIQYQAVFGEANAYDHTTLNAPVLVRSPKLSNVGPG